MKGGPSGLAWVTKIIAMLLTSLPRDQRKSGKIGKRMIKINLHINNRFTFKRQ